KRVDELEESAAAAKNELARKSPEVPTIVSAIKQNAHDSSSSPLAQSVSYMRVCDGKWTLAIECAIGIYIESFVLHSHNQRQTLFDLCRQLGIKLLHIILTNFGVPPDTRRNEPSEIFSPLRE
ncbi:hypothetical protein PENTCL1PPCAC_6235, partial [Pristionchus entomophagus]